MILAVLRRLRPSENNTSGNAMIYVLVAIALFGILTATLSSQNNQSDGQDIDDEMVALYANEILEYSAAAKQVVDQMIMTGSTIDDLDFVNPTSAAFDTPPHIHKVFHPQGGGLNYIERHGDLNIAATWEAAKTRNVEWTNSGASDVLLTLYRVNSEICRVINEKITGDTVIPALSGNVLTQYFDDAHSTPLDLNTTECPDCEGYPTLCVARSDLQYNAYYTILAAR